MVKKQKRKQYFFDNLTVICFLIMFLFSCVMILVCWNIFAEMPPPTAPTYKEDMLIAILIFVSTVCPLFWVIAFQLEYYVFTENQIIARSILQKKKVVDKDSIQKIYKQYITRCNNRYFDQQWYFVLDDGSSFTVGPRPITNKRDLMKILMRKKTEKLIKEFWDKEIEISNFIERK